MSSISLEQSETLVKASFPNASRILNRIPGSHDLKLCLYSDFNPPQQADKLTLIQNSFSIAQNEEILGHIKTIEALSKPTTNIPIFEALQNINSKLDLLEVIGERLNNLEKSVKTLETKVTNLQNI